MSGTDTRSRCLSWWILVKWNEFNTYTRKLYIYWGVWYLQHHTSL